jgi:aspartyl aminopeptidase
MNADATEPWKVDLESLCRYLDQSPSPFHAVASSAAMLDAAGFTRWSWDDEWNVEQVRAQGLTGGYLIRDGALFAWRTDHAVDVAAPYRIVGAHTDSPGLRIKPRPEFVSNGWRQLEVEVYGGALLHTWLDRDLGLAGRLALRAGGSALVRLERPIARIPSVAIHLDREVNDRGLMLDKQAHLSPVWATDLGLTGHVAPNTLAEYLLQGTGLDPTEIAGWELMLYDITPAAVLGVDGSLLASGRLDNLVSCWAATQSMISAQPSPHHVDVIALFDHEEVGSSSATGASGPMLEMILERLSMARGADRTGYYRAIGGSLCISADNAHAVHPNYSDRHDPLHRPMVNRGPAIKDNVNQRYATTSLTSAVFQRACRAAQVPWQVFSSRNTIPCGSTIGPLASTRLGIDTVDIGVPQLSMHSARELCGAMDPHYLAAALTAFFNGA